VIQIENVSFRYRGQQAAALEGISLQIGRGQVFGLLGPNGAGKTTLISLLNGLLTPGAGTIRIAGLQRPAQHAEIARISALVPQEYAFYPTLTVAENLHFFARAIGLAGTPIKTATERVVAATHLQAQLRQRAEYLSGGLKRRLNLAIGLLGEPQLLYLDEPTVGIDPQSRHFILDTIRALAEGGTTVVYSSHYMDEVEYLAQDVAIIDHGKVLAQGRLSDLLASRSSDVQLTLTLPPTPALAQQLLQINGLVAVHECQLQLCADTRTLAQLLLVLDEHGNAPLRIQQGLRNLEDLFMQLTQRSLRD
jgi:ABC-2 type transport system ATP-binding protein